MALEDGGVLGLYLARMQDKLSASKKLALKVYEDCRWERTERIVARGSFNQHIYHLYDGPEQEEPDRRFKEYEDKDHKWKNTPSFILPVTDDTGEDPFLWRYHGVRR